MSDEISRGVPKRSDPLPREPADHDDDLFPNIRSQSSVTSEDRLFAIFAHLGGYITWIFAPLILLLVQKDRTSFGAWHAREALNFNICVMIYILLPTPLMCLAFIDHWMILIAIGLYVVSLLLVALFQLIVVIVAGVQAYRGVRWRCPLTIRFVPHPETVDYSDDHADLD